MQPNPNESPGFFNDSKSMFNLLSILCDIAAFPVMICTTRWGTWGHRFLNSPIVLIGFFWPLIFAGFYGPHPQTGTLLVFWCASIGVLLIHRVRGVWRYRQGYRCHSRYWGDAWTQRSGEYSEQRRARGRMIFLSLMVGIGLVALSLEPLGAMIVFGAIAKLGSDMMVFAAVDARVRQMEDARLENDYYWQTYRQRNDWE